MCVNPLLFSQDKYVKYWVWMMADRSVPVRKEVLRGIQGFYDIGEIQKKGKPVHATKLNLGFTKKILPRCLEMTQDVNDTVVTSATKLLTVLFQQNLLTAENVGGQRIEESLDFIQDNIFDESKSIRFAAAHFATVQYVELHTSNKNNAPE